MNMEISVARGMGVLEERADVLAMLDDYIKGVADLSELPDTEAKDVIAVVVDGIVESLNKLRAHIESGEHRSSVTDSPRACWAGSRGTLIIGPCVPLGAFGDETFIPGLACAVCSESMGLDDIVCTDCGHVHTAQNEGET